MIYIVQQNVFRETNYDIIFEALTRLGLEYEVIECLPNSDKFDFVTDRKDVFTFGSIRMAKLAVDNGWEPGSFFGGNHDYSIYSEHYKENLLNYNCLITKFGDTSMFKQGMIQDDSELYFIRPCKDSKLFNGQLFTRTKWEDLITTRKENINFKEEMLSELIQVGENKKIYKEARTWVIDGKIVTSSYYRFGQHVAYEENVEPDGLEFAQRMVDLYQVAPAFVMDICLTPDGWKIVEINCINCSGFYKGDMQKVLIALEDKFNPIPKN
jgi:hypothetical protein